MAGPRLYLIPGMGVDGRLFDRQRSLALDVRVIEWPTPQREETFSQYVARMTEGVDASAPFYLGGVSLGGMAAIEMTRRLRPRGVFLISSCCSPAGIPAWYWTPGMLACRLPAPVSRLLATAGMMSPWPFGPMSWDARRLMLRMVWESPPATVAWQMRAVLRWTAPPPCETPIFQIHGRHDRMLPLRLKSRDMVVDGAGHLLNVTHAERVNRFIMARISEMEMRSATPPQDELPGPRRATQR